MPRSIIDETPTDYQSYISHEVTMTLDRSALSFFNPELHEWVAEPGRFDLLIGSASDDIRQRTSITLK